MTYLLAAATLIIATLIFIVWWSVSRNSEVLATLCNSSTNEENAKIIEYRNLYKTVGGIAIQSSDAQTYFYFTDNGALVGELPVVFKYDSLISSKKITADWLTEVQSNFKFRKGYSCRNLLR